MADVTISARIPEELSHEINRMAQALNRTRTWVVEEALRGYIASEKQFLEAVAEGIRDMEAGRVVPHEAVMKEIDDLLATYPDVSA